MESFDKLEKIFEMQKMLDQDIIERRGLNEISSSQWIQKKVLATISELAELLDEVNFKWWKNPKKEDPKLIKEELIDILHFFISMCISAGMTAEEMFDIYMDKNKENFNRQTGESSKKGYNILDT